MSKTETLQLINSTAAVQIADLDLVKEKFITNYNLANASTNGDIMYHRQQIFFNQAIAASDGLKSADKFSLYACFINAAVKGYSFDPLDNEVYLIPRAGKAILQIQAGAHVRRLIQSGQATECDQAKLVYKGDTFMVEDGEVKKHIETFETEEIIAGYVKFTLIGGAKKHFIYRKSDFESWRKKSPNPKTIQKTATWLSESLWDNGEVNGKNPEPNFLRTKIILHASKEKCWRTGSLPLTVEVFDVEQEALEELPQAPVVEKEEKEFLAYEELKEEESFNVPEDNESF